MKTFKIKNCDVDFKDELKMSAVLSYLEEVACLSADELGFGYSSPIIGNAKIKDDTYGKAFK